MSDEDKARLRGHIAADMAADHAGDQWKRDAFLAFCAYARAHDTFRTEDVRSSIYAIDAGDPPDGRAWGHIAKRAQREGVVEARGWVPSVSSNGRAVTQWRSLLKGAAR